MASQVVGPGSDHLFWWKFIPQLSNCQKLATNTSFNLQEAQNFWTRCQTKQSKAPQRNSKGLPKPTETVPSLSTTALDCIIHQHQAANINLRLRVYSQQKQRTCASTAPQLSASETSFWAQVPQQWLHHTSLPDNMRKKSSESEINKALRRIRQSSTKSNLESSSDMLHLNKFFRRFLKHQASWN